MPERETNRRELSLDEAAERLGLLPVAVQGLVFNGFLSASTRDPTGHPRFDLADVKAFAARNADNGSGFLSFDDTELADPQDLLEALDGEAENMAKRAFELFATVFPVAGQWSLREQRDFVTQAKARFEAILAVTGSGAEVDEALVGDLQDVGAEAAWSGSSLPQLLVVLRISRDLVVQTAVRLAEERGGHWAMALSLLLTRILPAVDRLTDSLAQGYWDAIVSREEDARARYQHVVEGSSDGVYEVDIDGFLTYANPSLEVILGRSFLDMSGEHLSDFIDPVDTSISVDELLGEPVRMQVTVLRPDGVRRVLDVRSSPRLQDGEPVGYQGFVRDVTASADLEADKNEFLALVTHDLRQPLTTILGLGATLESHADELPQDQVRRMAGQIRRQAERMARMADDLYDISRLEAQSLLLAPRPTDLARAVDSALAGFDDVSGVRVDVREGVEVLADPRRLEQVLANLIENGLKHGGGSVSVTAWAVPGPDGGSGTVDVSITDSGPGVPDFLIPTLFSGVRTLSSPHRDRSRGSGLGLALVKGLVEAMGGRVWYDKSAGNSTFHCLLLRPRSR